MHWKQKRPLEHYLRAAIFVFMSQVQLHGKRILKHIETFWSHLNAWKVYLAWLSNLTKLIYVLVYEKLLKCRGGSRAAATSKMERFVIIVNSWKPLTIITKLSILDDAAALDLLLKCITNANNHTTEFFCDSYLKYSTDLVKHSLEFEIYGKIWNMFITLEQRCSHYLKNKMFCHANVLNVEFCWNIFYQAWCP